MQSFRKIRRLAGLFLGAALLATPALAASSNLRIAYVRPQNADHMEIYKKVRDARVLERLRARLSNLRLPRPLLIRIKGCDGNVNAFYDPSDDTLNVCYEYIKFILDVAAHIPEAGVKEGLTPANYPVGPLLEVLLHELSHAVFHMKKVPILGREEDAADRVAAYVLLSLGRNETRRVIASIAVLYMSQAKTVPTELQEFADVHGMPAQRFYDLMCISYGSDEKKFADFIEKGYLPADRAESCPDEYRQVKYAFERLVSSKGSKGKRHKT